MGTGQEDYAFVRVTGDGVHEIAVGPVHAGIIEPGHFRFQVVGEKVLRLEERLGYAAQGHREALRIAAAASTPIGLPAASPATAPSPTPGLTRRRSNRLAAVRRRRRAPRGCARLCLERERIGNHLGDLGYLGNDGGFAFGHSQFSRLREDMLRLNDRAFGHRLLMDVVVPGGVDARSLAPRTRRGCASNATRSSASLPCCATSTTSMPGCRTGFAAADEVTRELAHEARPDRPRRSRQRACRRSALRFRTGRPTTRSACGGRRMPMATLPRASPCASMKRSNRCAWSARYLRRCPTATSRRTARSAGFAAGDRLCRGLARPGLHRAGKRARRHDPALPSARPILAELAGDRARGDRQHRSRLSADQQVVQPFLQRPRSIEAASDAAHPPPDRTNRNQDRGCRRRRPRRWSSSRGCKRRSCARLAAR